MLSCAAKVVWELRGLVEDVECFFLRRGGEYVLVIERAGEWLLEEEHDEFVAMMARARDLRSSLVRVGFTPVVVDPDAMPNDSLLHHFVRLGVAPLVAAGQRPS